MAIPSSASAARSFSLVFGRPYFMVRLDGVTGQLRPRLYAYSGLTEHVGVGMAQDVGRDPIGGSSRSRPTRSPASATIFCIERLDKGR